MDKDTHDNNESREIEERREFIRFPVNLHLRFKEPNTNAEKEVQIHDISANGVCIWTGQELVNNTTLELWIEIPSDGQVRYNKGKVVWSKLIEPNKYKVGISLERVDLICVSLILRATYGTSWL